MSKSFLNKLLGIGIVDIEFDEKNAIYDTPSSRLEHACNITKYLNWNSVPAQIQEFIKVYVRPWLDSESWSNPEMYVPGYMFYIRKGVPGKHDIAILCSNAIIDILANKNTKIPFILSTDGQGWTISRIYNPQEHVEHTMCSTEVKNPLIII